MPMSDRMRTTIDSSHKADKKRQLAGQILLIATVLVVLYICYWVMTHEDGRRFRGIEKFRSDIGVTELVRVV